jgi:hypothetical protein
LLHAPCSFSLDKVSHFEHTWSICINRLKLLNCKLKTSVTGIELNLYKLCIAI